MKRNNPFIVAELSGNHLGRYDNAVKLIRAAKDAGADAVKLQTFFPYEMALNIPIKSGPWAGRTYIDLYRETMLPWGWHEGLFQEARDLGLIIFSTPFSLEGVARLETLDCPIYKIASPEICYQHLIVAAAKTGKPLIISTGMASVTEIYRAAAIATVNGCTDLTFLHCISAYPANAEDFNMRTVATMAKAFKVGLSDHSLSATAAIMAVTLGATVIEKHLCLSRALGGPDAAFSLEPHEFHYMVDKCREAAAALGYTTFGCREAERDSYQYRRSIWTVRDIQPGQAIQAEDLAILRPNYGLDPSKWDSIIGVKAKMGIPAFSPMAMEFLE